MKLRLSSGSITEDINLIANAPTTPYLEIKENNNIVGYVKLNPSGTSKFTFNGMYANNLNQYIFLIHSNGLYVYDTDLVERKFIKYTSYSGDVFFVENKETIFILSYYYNSIYKIDCNELTLTKVLTIDYPKEMCKTSDNHYWILHKNGSNFNLTKYTKDFQKVNTRYVGADCTNFHADTIGHIYCYETSNYTKKYDLNYNYISSNYKTGNLIHIGNNNKLYNRDFNTLNIYDTNFNKIDTYSDPNYDSIREMYVSNQDEVYLQIGPEYNKLRISLYDVKTKTFVFKDKPDTSINSVSMDQSSNIYTMTLTTITKRDRNYNKIKNLNFGGNHAYRICINADRS